MASLVKTPFKVKVGGRIQRAREALGKRQVDVYSAIGVSSGKYSQWENGLALPRLEEAIDLVGNLRTSLDYIFRGIGAPHIPDQGEPSPESPTRTHSVPVSSIAVPLKTGTK